MKSAKLFVDEAVKYIGTKEGSAKHKELINIYNAHKPLAHGYEMGVKDAWCAMFVSAIAIKCGYTDIIPCDIRCSSFIEKFKKMNAWIEDDSYKPCIGDIIFYDWEDTGTGDNTATPNHVGIVSNVSGQFFEVVEGNKNNAVGIRTVEMNGKYIRGYGVPRFEDDAVSSIIYVIQKGDTLRKIANLHGVTVSDILACNATIQNPDKIQAGWKLIVPRPSVSEGFVQPPANPSETADYYEIGKRFASCIDAIKGLPEYAALLEEIRR